MLFTPANQTIYPYMAKIYNKQKEKFFDFTKKVGFSFFGTGVILFILLALLNNHKQKIYPFLNNSYCLHFNLYNKKLYYKQS